MGQPAQRVGLADLVTTLGSIMLGFVILESFDMFKRISAILGGHLLLSFLVVLVSVMNVFRLIHTLAILCKDPAYDEQICKGNKCFSFFIVELFCIAVVLAAPIITVVAINNNESANLCMLTKEVKSISVYNDGQGPIKETQDKLGEYCSISFQTLFWLSLILVAYVLWDLLYFVADVIHKERAVVTGPRNKRDKWWERYLSVLMWGFPQRSYASFVRAWRILDLIAFLFVVILGGLILAAKANLWKYTTEHGYRPYIPPECVVWAFWTFTIIMVLYAIHDYCINRRFYFDIQPKPDAQQRSSSRADSESGGKLI